RSVPGHVVGQRRNVVHPVGDRDILVVIEVLADFLEAAMEIADVWDGIDDPLAVKFENEAERGMRGRMLRAEVERPQVVLLLGTLFESSFSQIHKFEIRSTKSETKSS